MYLLYGKMLSSPAGSGILGTYFVRYHDFALQSAPHYARVALKKK
jgi:hypothetical protein